MMARPAHFVHGRGLWRCRLAKYQPAMGLPPSSLYIEHVSLEGAVWPDRHGYYGDIEEEPAETTSTD